MSATSVILGGRLFTDRPSPGGLGFSGLTGWRDTPQGKSGVNERPRAHGAFGVSQVFRPALPISFRAILHPRTEEELLVMQEDLASIGFDGPVPLRVIEPTGTTERLVTVEAATLEGYRGGSTLATMPFDLLARDPLRYSVDDSWQTARPPLAGGGLVWPALWPAIWRGSPGSDGRISLVNRGTKPSHPIFRVYGGFDGFTLTNVGQQMRVSFTFPVAAGSYVEVDFAKRRALLGGVSDVSRYLVMREWWQILPGPSAPVQIAIDRPTGDPYMAGMVRSAW